MTFSDARVVHKGAPFDDGVAVGNERPATGLVELVLTCPTCEERVTVTVLSRGAARRERAWHTVLALGVAVGAFAVGVWVMRSDAVHDGFFILAAIVVVVGLSAAFESSATMDDGVRLRRSPRHDLDRPGWPGSDDYEPTGGE